MLTRKYLGVAAACGVAFAGFGSAFAQTTVPATAPAAVPAVPVAPGATVQGVAVVPAVPVTTPNGNLAGPTRHAQVISGITGTSTAATPGSLGADGLPSLDNAQAGNVTGVLSYCIHRKLVYGTTPRSVARHLAHRPDVKNDQFYSLGGRGLLQNGTSTPFDISTLPHDKQVLVCQGLIKKGQSLQN